MSRMEELVDAAKMLAGEAGGGSNAVSLEFLLGLDAKATRLVMEACATAVEEHAAARGIEPTFKALHVGIELGIAAERMRTRSAAS